MTLKSLLILAAVACSAKVGWADHFYIFDSTIGQPQSSFNLPDGSYVVKNGSTLTLTISSAHGGGGPQIHSQWTVIKDTEAIALDEFISSGRLCAWRGKHMNQIKVGSCQTIFQKCLICGQSITKP